MDCAPTSDKTDKFADYFCSTYVETTTFPPSLWAQIPSDVHRTNDGPESFHRHFCCQFIFPHPTFYIFWGAIVRQQTVSHVIMNELTTGIAAPITVVEQKT